ncbi:hypothetical protein [Emticicia sp. 17c]|uniref:hypothetical protein n=1 Tax=Emticicia sp. 17c TaxID=3127704 RepID=UPI00301CAC18
MNIRYLLLTAFLLISEFFFIGLPPQQSEFWIAFIRIIAALVLSLWYYQHRKPLSTNIDKLFITTLILPVLISVGVMISPALIKNINLIIHAFILCLWACIFKLMGAKIKFQGAFYKFIRIIPVYALFPILFYIITLHPALPVSQKIMLLCYTLLYIYTATLSSFLPIKDVERFWISWSVVLMAFANLLVFYSFFVEPLPWLGFIPRLIVIIARCILIIGMVDYFSSRQSSSTQPLTSSD